MELEKVTLIIEKLMEKIDDPKLSWEQVDNFRYGTKLGKIWVSFRKYHPEDPYEEETIYIDFTSADGNFIESFSDSELKSVMPSAYTQMSRLWKIAKMRSSGFDKLLDDVLEDLE